MLRTSPGHRRSSRIGTFEFALDDAAADCRLALREPGLAPGGLGGERKRVSCRSRDRRGVLTVEMAICVPILFLILLGALEFSRMNMLRNSIDNAAYEGARRGVVPGATASDCTNSALAVLTAVGARSATVSVAPPVIDDTTMQVSVTISVPLSSNSWGPARFLSGATLRSVSTKSREFVGQLVPTSVP